MTDDVLHAFEHAYHEPVIFQEEIIGADVRVNMLNGQVLSAHVICKSDASILDYRTDPAYHTGQAQYEPVQLDAATITACDLAMKKLSLRFSGIDLRMTPQGEFVLLECNSMPAFLDIEIKTHSPIADNIIEAMIRGDNMSTHDRSHSMERLSSNRIESRTPIYDKEGYFFDYHQIAEAYWRSELSHEGRTIIKLNDAQQKQFLSETGEVKQFMQLERQSGQLHIIGLW
ncbi:ATP-grasp domain-containing protein [Paenibacillus hexagrammi]|uniref:ATP-grasp domain-containing protein n=1 Tax=Paenibacillus hexagrammi TaxID=2908839 RepID=A0ABY3SM06_9BACL|nr:hypothetical protein [Paenibacillus sp. YPD9-1]UJF34221.1 hypothetical protein L0M14_03035 [Paenibacillus sp. YPD9-1]